MFVLPEAEPGAVVGGLLLSEPSLDVVSLGDGDGELGDGVTDGVVLGEVGGDVAGGGLKAGADVLQLFPLEGLLEVPEEGAGDELRVAGVPAEAPPLPEFGFVPVGEVECEAGEAPESMLNAA